MVHLSRIAEDFIIWSSEGYRFIEVDEKSPEGIINHLKSVGSSWAGDKDPDDDVTFVVIQMK